MVSQFSQCKSKSLLIVSTSRRLQCPLQVSRQERTPEVTEVTMGKVNELIFADLRNTRKDLRFFDEDSVRKTAAHVIVG